MDGYDHKSLNSPQKDAAALHLGGKIYRLTKGSYLIGRNSEDFVIEDDSVDDKHALINIIDARHQIIDLQSKQGTYVDNKKIHRNYLINNKVSILRFGNLNANYTVLNQSDSGFFDNKSTTPDKDNFDMVASSPQQSRYARVRNINRRFSLVNTSTPNASSSYNKENQIESRNLKNDNSHSNSVKSGAVNHSFYVPETQHLDETKVLKGKNKNIFDSELEDSVRQFINDKSLEDEYYIPETQEIFLISKKDKSNEMVNINSQGFHAFAKNNISKNNLSHNEMFNINSQDFHGFAKNNISKNDLSQNLCPFLSINKNITNSLKEKTNSNEIEDMTQLEWNESELENRSNATTPDIDFETLPEVSKTKDDISDQRQSSDVKDLVQVTNKEMVKFSSLWKENANNSVQKNHTGKPQINNTHLNNFSKSEVCNDFMDNDDLMIPTQPFFLNTVEKCSFKRCASPKFDENFDLMEETAIFHHPVDNPPLISKVPTSKQDNSLNSDQSYKLTKENKVNIDENNTKVDEEDEEIACTQVFIPPNKKNQHIGISQKNLVTAPLNSGKMDDLECTQTFVHPGSLKSNLSSTTFSSNSFVRTENIKNKKRSKDISSEMKQPLQKKRTSYAGSDSTKNFKTPANVSPDTPVAFEDADFMMDICTPAIDFIKFPPKEIGYMKVIEKIKKPINRIFGEESEDEDDATQLFQIDQELKSKTIRVDINSEKGNKSEVESEETPEFLKPVMSVKGIKNLEKSNFVSKKKKKFIMEETQTFSDDTDFDELENQVNTNKKSKCVAAFQDSNKNYNKTKKAESTGSKGTSRKKTTSKLLVDELDVEKKCLRSDLNNQRVKKSEINSETSIKTSSSSRCLRKNKKSVKFSEDSNELENQFNTNSETNSAFSDRSVKSNSSSRVSRRKKTTVTFTKVNEEKYIETIKNIGYTMVNDPEDASIIITNNDISRTWKFLIGLAKGIPIISVDWLEAIQEKNFSYVHYDNYYVKDKKAEKKFNFILRETLKLASTSNQQLFSGYNFVVTKNTNPPKLEMEKIIQCAGGTIINQTKTSPKLIYAVSDKKDASSWSTLKLKFDNLIIIKTEGVLLSIMQHRNRLDDHKFL